MNMRNDRAGLQGSAQVLGRSTISIYVSKFITVLQVESVHVMFDVFY